MSKPTSTVKMLIPVTSLEGNQKEMIGLAVLTMRAVGICVETFNTEMKPIELLTEDPADELLNIEVCNPETVCAETCQEIAGCKKQ